MLLDIIESAVDAILSLLYGIVSVLDRFEFVLDAIEDILGSISPPRNRIETMHNGVENRCGSINANHESNVKPIESCVEAIDHMLPTQDRMGLASSIVASFVEGLAFILHPFFVVKMS